MYSKNRRQEPFNANCLAVIDFVFILPKETAPAWTINWNDDELYDLNVYESFKAISSSISG